MHCSRVRTAVSARLDGEELPPGVTDGLLDAHLAGCADCRLWSERASALDGLLDRLRGPAAYGGGEDRSRHQ
ncbi:zf-HC2 domain-containing protein [Streptomyces chrestomyceticus]|uniref:zf-HC2 domain-containing protein n=1 Tax=Streptomyces chrestomyceticus TaxID=68185 RepID=UPI0019D02A42|nr:zf-HC2 domain-containing protein [Streptomyces chrestomyceticus]